MVKPMFAVFRHPVIGEFFAGQLSYNSYWSSEILSLLKDNYDKSLSIVDIALVCNDSAPRHRVMQRFCDSSCVLQATAFNLEDIQHTLNLLGILKLVIG